MIAIIISFVLGTIFGWYAFIKNPRIGDFIWMLFHLISSWVKVGWAKLFKKE